MANETSRRRRLEAIGKIPRIGIFYSVDEMFDLRARQLEERLRRQTPLVNVSQLAAETKAVNSSDLSIDLAIFLSARPSLINLARLIVDQGIDIVNPGITRSACSLASSLHKLELAGIEVPSMVICLHHRTIPAVVDQSMFPLILKAETTYGRIRRVFYSREDLYSFTVSTEACLAVPLEPIVGQAFIEDGQNVKSYFVDNEVEISSLRSADSQRLDVAELTELTRFVASTLDLDFGSVEFVRQPDLNWKVIDVNTFSPLAGRSNLQQRLSELIYDRVSPLIGEHG